MSKKLIVAKFGGTSMADSSAISQSAQVAISNEASLIVVSATSGTTDKILAIAKELRKNPSAAVDEAIDEIRQKHYVVAEELGASQDTKNNLSTAIEEFESLVKNFRLGQIEPKKALDGFLSLGEELSSRLMVAALSNAHTKATLLDARDVIKTDNNFGQATPQVKEIAECAKKILLPELEKGEIFVTQGFIGQAPDNSTATLGRGGSDYSAALFAEALEATQLQIWTDVSGIATTDPRISKNTKKIESMTFQEAAELATAGAKILYPRMITPARRANIPVFVGNTFDPKGGGTTISKQSDHQPLVRAIALKTNQSIVTLTSPEMAHQFGYLAKIFDIFGKYKISIDQVSTSEISIAVILENATILNQKLLDELEGLAKIKTESGVSVISLIGNNVNNTPGLARDVFVNLEADTDKISVRMICQGASKHNFCFIVGDEHGPNAIRRLHRSFIEERS